MSEFKSINDILDFAIQNEQKSIDFYTELAKNARTTDMKEVFEQFTKEEIGHKARLTKIKDEGLFTMPVEKVMDLKISDYVVRIEPKPNMSYEEALVIAMKREKSAFKLYLALSDRAPNGELKHIFLALAMEESKHKLRFELEYDEFVLKEN
ncbi:MAG: rubrerythrin [Bacteroidetes bacterium GWA2_30_7]|nr:MAG: rubrerythrin [Bacteroidetes bacterium GWA2_30_7]